jgi:translocation and assembly module TamB
LDIKAEAPGRLMVSGLGLDSEWRANLLVQGSIFSPAISGTADMVRGGYEFAGRRFDVQRGIIRFRGESPPDPILDIVAQGDTQGLTATIRVAGTGQRPDISFASVPALPQEELLSRLLFGTSITSLSAPEAVQLAAAVASMRGGAGLNPINALRKAVGLDRLRILPGNVATGQRTSVAAGKYLTRRTFVEVITDGQGYSATRAEFQVTRWLSILSTISTLGNQSASVRVSRDY